MAAPKVEHRAVIVGPLNADALQAALDTASADGWQLISTLPVERAAWLLFQRPKRAVRAAVDPEEAALRHREALKAQRAGCPSPQAAKPNGGRHMWTQEKPERCVFCNHTKAWAEGLIEAEG